jgi:UPF0042 nucleotide-binding protein
MSRKAAKQGKKPQPELVIITGLSGSGKGTVLKCLEDLGFYAVDNLPMDLVPTFAELTKDSPNITRAALVIDVRAGIARFPQLYKKVSRRIHTTLVFLEADDDTLVRRYSETRRPHPLGSESEGPLAEMVEEERQRLSRVRELADHRINTSKFNVHDLRALAKETFGEAGAQSKIVVYVNSFGFRHGVPADSDLVFDVRFLPNPNYIPEYRELTGRNPRVARYIRSFPQTVEFIERISELLIYLLPHYIREGKSYLTISFGCTGGHHRSVMIADSVRKRLNKAGYSVRASHRDVSKPV